MFDRGQQHVRFIDTIFMKSSLGNLGSHEPKADNTRDTEGPCSACLPIPVVKKTSKKRERKDSGYVSIAHKLMDTPLQQRAIEHFGRWDGG